MSEYGDSSDAVVINHEIKHKIIVHKLWNSYDMLLKVHVLNIDVHVYAYRKLPTVKKNVT